MWTIWFVGTLRRMRVMLRYALWLLLRRIYMVKRSISTLQICKTLRCLDSWIWWPITPSKMEKLISLAQVEQLIDEMERSSDIYWIWKIFRDFKSKLSSLPTEESGWIAYKEYCTWPYEKWDVIEVLVCLDVDDWFRHEPETQYWYVDEFDLISMNRFEWNKTSEVFSIWEVKTSNQRKTFKQLDDFWQFDGSYILHHRKIEIENHPWYNPKTKIREELTYSEPT